MSPEVEAHLPEALPALGETTFRAGRGMHIIVCTPSRMYIVRDGGDAFQDWPG